MSKGKKYKAAAAKFDPLALYSLEDAVKLALDTSVTKFDSSVEVHMNLGIDPKQAEQQIRSTVSLPHGIGKTVRVVAFVPEDKVKEAKDAGAIEAGSEDLIAKIENGWLDFDKAVATPDMMKNLGKIARTLGQAGMMPNPKSGTVSPDVSKTVTEIMKGQVEFRNDKLSNLHNIVGKVSFGEAKILENLKVYLKAVKEKKPEKMKGNYVRSLYLATTMGPGIKLDVTGAFGSL
ncbi:50S ribosomal protein L1 [Candidatus Peregrinibacteria bacterium]|jgi:large subunit ribosomal protein L1|nr:50S ribosomal protein L1 [Candidatus Peregrinibacteria bacterium]MBT5823786.1 50S ribosomal protein L1 [Candidatus Peregrinibacteria bacterium]